MGDRPAGDLSPSLSVTRGAVIFVLGLLVPAAMTAIIALMGAYYAVPFLYIYLYLPILLLVAYVGGLVPGVLAAGASTVLAAYYFMEPDPRAAPLLQPRVLPALLFLLSGVLLAVAGVQTRQHFQRLQLDLSRSRRRQRHEAFLVEIADMLMARPGRETLVPSLCERCAAFYGDWCAFVLLDPEDGSATQLTTHGPPAGLSDPQRRGLELALVQREDPFVRGVLSAPAAVQMNREGAPAQRPSLLDPAWFDHRGVWGALAAPLRLGDELVGLVAVFAAHRREWDQEDARLLQAVAERAALSIHQGRLREQRRRREQETRFLGDLMVELTQQQDLASLLQVIARRCTDLLAEWCGIEVIERGNPVMRLGALHHRDPEKVRRLEAVLTRAPMAVDHPLVRRILDAGRPVVFHPDDPVIQALLPQDLFIEEVFERLHLRAGLGVPLYVRGQVAGILGMGTESARGWSEDDLRLAALIADRAAVAIENARLIEAEREAREAAERETGRLAAINQVIALAASALDLGEVFDEFAEALRVLLPFVRTSVTLYDPARDWLTVPYFKGPALTAPRESMEGPKAGTVRGVVLDSGRPYARTDTLARQEFMEDRLLGGAGIRSYLVVPLAVSGRVIGTLNFAHDQPGFYTPEHARLVQPVADQLAMTISRFQLVEEAQRRAGELSEILQRALLPMDLPRSPFTAIGAVYRPADPEAKIGGDWYEATQLPDDRLLVGIGDVAGHGLAAATRMGQVRYVVRAHAVEGRSPAEILTAVNRLVLSLPEGETQLSMWIGIYDPLSGDLVYSSAGHPPPCVLAGGDLRLLAVGGPPLGIAVTTTYDEVREQLLPGSRLVAYTDGLTEARRDVVDGERRLVEAVAATATQRPGRAVEALLDHALDGALPHDDVALLILDILPADAPLFLSLPASAQHLRRVRRTLRAFALRNGVPPARVEEMVIAVGEAALNVVEHAYASGTGLLIIQGERRQDTLTVTVRDFGRWGTPVERGRGRGIRLMQGFADTVRTTTSPAGTIVELTWDLRAAPASLPGPS